ncbi:MAG TPA: amino acid permease, partial [Coxiellaceae bacterium]|nr:amino acid permease [Coxiellaceae bacterium]
MDLYHKIRNKFFGPPKDPFSPEVRSRIALAAFMAWIGMGADGLSSSAYGPEQAYIALGPHGGLALYLAIATFVTVFIIAFAYNQVIELFPNGGGGYRVAQKLIGPKTSLISGSALIIDYVLTIAVSISSGVDALLSFMPLAMQDYSLSLKAFVLILLLYLNLRGLKESIRVL